MARDAQLEAQVLDALRFCRDPEAGLNVVDLGLIDEIRVTDGAATVRMTMVTEGSRHAAWLSGEVARRAKSVAGVHTADVNVVLAPRWTTSRISEQVKRRLHAMTGE